MCIRLSRTLHGFFLREYFSHHKPGRVLYVSTRFLIAASILLAKLAHRYAISKPSQLSSRRCKGLFSAELATLSGAGQSVTLIPGWVCVREAGQPPLFYISHIFLPLVAITAKLFTLPPLDEQTQTPPTFRSFCGIARYLALQTNKKHRVDLTQTS